MKKNLTTVDLSKVENVEIQLDPEFTLDEPDTFYCRFKCIKQ